MAFGHEPAAKIEEKYILAIDKMLVGIASSDFCTEYGTNAAYGLREYRLDMALDLQQSLEGTQGA